MLAANRHQTACSRLISSIFLVVLTVSLPIGLMAADKALTADQLFAPEHVVDVKITLAEKDRSRTLPAVYYSQAESARARGHH